MDLITALDRAMEADSRPTRERQNHTAWDIGKCTRQLFYKWVFPHEAERKLDAGFSWKLRLGEAVEEIVVRWLSQAGVFHTSGKWDTWSHPELTYPLRYQTDLEILDVPDNVLAVVDVKSGYGGEISEMKRTGRPKAEYEAQLAFYCIARRRKRGYLLFVGRDSAYRTSRMYEWRKPEGALASRFTEINVHTGEEVRDTGITWEGQLGKLKTLEAALGKALPAEVHHGNLETVAPPREYMMAIKDGELRDNFQADSVRWTSDAQCRYCAYQKRCWGPVLADYPKGTNNVEELKAAGIEGKPVKKQTKESTDDAQAEGEAVPDQGAGSLPEHPGGAAPAGGDS